MRFSVASRCVGRQARRGAAERRTMRKIVMTAVAVMVSAGVARAADPVSVAPDELIAQRQAGFDSHPESCRLLPGL